MIKRTLFATAALALAGLGAAQINPPTDVALRLGTGFVLEKNTRDIIGDTPLIGFGLDYFLPRPLLPRGETYLSVDWLGKTGGGDKGNIFPFFINHRIYNVDDIDLRGQRTYFFGGIGGAVIDVTDTATVLAIRGGFGVEFGNHLFFEGNVVFSDVDADTRASSLGLYVGYRF